MMMPLTYGTSAAESVPVLKPLIVALGLCAQSMQAARGRVLLRVVSLGP